MESAIKACQEEGLSCNAAALKFNIPRTTLQRRLSGIPETRRGPKLKFSPEEEDYLVTSILKVAAIGIPFEKSLLKKLIIRICSSRDLSDFKFSDKWYKKLQDRNTILSERIFHGVNYQEDREWSVETEEGWLRILNDLHMDGYLDDPEGVHSLDESIFDVTDNISLVKTRVGNKNTSAVTEELITVISCGTAGGSMRRPLALFEEQCIITLPNGECGKDDSISDVNDYLQKEVIQQMTARKNVIFVDGYSSFVTNEEFLYNCLVSDKDIRIICFPAGQINKKSKNPSTFSVVGPFRKYWTEYLRSENNSAKQVVSKQRIASKLIQTLSSSNMENDLRSTFKDSGIFPYDVSLIFTPAQLAAFAARKKESPKKPPVKQPPTGFSGIYSTQLISVRKLLQQIPPISELARRQIMKHIVRVGESRCAEIGIGMFPLPVENGEGNPEPMEEAVVQPPLKKRKLKKN